MEHQTGSQASVEELTQAKQELLRGEIDAAEKRFRWLLEQPAGAADPSHVAEAHFGIGAILLARGRQEEALDAFRSSFEGTITHLEGGVRWAELLMARKDLPGAKKVYEKVVAVAPALAEARYGLGLLAQEAGEAAQAIAQFRLAFETDPPHLEAGLRLAELLLATGEVRAACETYATIAARHPQLAEAHCGLGLGLLQRDRRLDAAAAFERALAITPNYPTAIVGRAFLAFFSRPAIERRSAPRPLICVPILPFVRDWLGGQIYALNFVRSLAGLSRDLRPRVVVMVLVDDWKDVPALNETVGRLLECDAVIGCFGRNRELISSSPMLARFRRRHVKRGDEDWTAALFANVVQSFPVLYPCWGIAPVGRPLFWIPDLQHRFLPANFSRAENLARDAEMMALAMSKSAVLFSSRDAQTHFHKFFPKPAGRTYTWHFCTLPEPQNTDADPGAYESLGLPERFYYTPNQFWPHKNHATLFRALRIVLDRGHDMTFVCTGGNVRAGEDPFSKQLAALIDELDLGRNLRLIGVLPRTLQLEVMRRACAVIQPSLFEGWSTVIEDARALGRPLIVSDISVHREQIGAAGRFFTPENPASLADVLLALDGSLTAGPDRLAEAAAIRDLEQRARESAKQFRNILEKEREFAISSAANKSSIAPSTERAPSVGEWMKNVPASMRHLLRRFGKTR